MCGRLNIEDPQKLSNLLSEFGWHHPPEAFISGRYKGAADRISILKADNQGQSFVLPAIWWLLLEPTGTGFKASKYTSFNTRYDKLDSKGSAGYLAYRQSRCIIPVNGFGESQPGPGRTKTYHDMTGADNPLLLGGLHRQWRHPKTGDVQDACSVITKPPHPKLMNIHSKSMPLILPHNPRLLRDWLNPEQQDVNLFEPLLQPYLPQDLNVQPIDKPSSYQPCAESFQIASD